MHTPATILFRHIERPVSYAVQIFTGAVLVAISAMLIDDVVGIYVTGQFATALAIRTMALFSVAGLLGLWFLMPRLFNRSLSAGRSGLPRLFMDATMLGLLVCLALLIFFTARTADTFSLSYVTQSSVAQAGGVWIGLFILTFLFPGFAFRRQDPMPSLRDTLRQQNADRPKVGRWRKCFALVLIAPQFIGLPGLIFLQWMPSADVLRAVNDYWSVIVAGFAVLTVITVFGLRLNPLGDRIKSPIRQKLLVMAGILGMTAYSITPAATVTLPWLSQYVLTTEPTAAVVQVTWKGLLGKLRGCDFAVFATFADDPGASAKVCDIAPDLWETLRTGDRLVLTGPGNRFGMGYTRIEAQKPVPVPLATDPGP